MGASSSNMGLGSSGPKNKTGSKVVKSKLEHAAKTGILSLSEHGLKELPSAVLEVWVRHAHTYKRTRTGRAIERAAAHARALSRAAASRPFRVVCLLRRVSRRTSRPTAV